MPEIHPRLIRLYQFDILKIANNMTIAQVVLNIFLAFFQEKNEDNPHTHNNPGAVPIANAIMISAPCMKFPVVMAYACIASVNQQGRKKVRAHVENAKICFEPHMSLHTFFHNDFGSVSERLLNFGDNSDKLIPRNNITSPVTTVIIQIMKGDRENICQKTPSIHHNNQNPIILHRLKYR